MDAACHATLSGREQVVRTDDADERGQSGSPGTGNRARADAGKDNNALFGCFCFVASIASDI